MTGRTDLLTRPPLLALAVLCPGLLWIAADRAVWPWDQAWFGAQTIALYETLRHEPLRWPSALMAATPLKPPAAAWIGQLFVPVGLWLRSVDRGLLLSVWLTHAAVLVVVFRALMELSAGRAPIAAAGALTVAAAPLFVALSTQYLAEGTQTLAVAWFVLIMAAAPRWGRARTLAHLLAAASFAMLAKTTSPVFCLVPGTIALAGALTRGGAETIPHTQGRRSARWLWAGAIAIALMTGAWYATNVEMVLLHARTAAFGAVAEHYGSRQRFLAAFRSWSALVHAAYFLTPVAAALATLAAFAAARRWRAASAYGGRLDRAAAACLLQIVVVLGVFAASPNREPRYLEALLPLAAVVIAWVAAAARWAAPLVIGLLAVQLALVQTQALGLWPGRPRMAAARRIVSQLIAPGGDAGPAATLAAIVERTCPPGSGATHFVGVDVLTLNGHSLTYAAGKQRLMGRAGSCRYDSAAFAPVESVEAALTAGAHEYWIAADPHVYPVPGYHAFLNESAPVVFRRLRGRGMLAEEPWDGPPGIGLYRFVRP